MKSTHIGRRFVPQRTIDDRVQLADDRINAATQRRAEQAARERVTHSVPFDAPGGRIVWARCGQFVDRDRDHSNTPTCPTCAELQAAIDADTRTADDVFGSVAPGPGPVKSKFSDPLRDYPERTR